MSIVKRIRLAVLFLIAAALLGGAAALGGAAGGNCSLTAVVDVSDPDYGASGVAKLENRKFEFYDPYRDWRVYLADVRVTCYGLTPGTTYIVHYNQYLMELTADDLGNGTATVRIPLYKTRSGWTPDSIWIGVYRPDGTQYGTLVLEGVLQPSGRNTPSGGRALSNVKVDCGNPGGWDPPIYRARLKVTCENLTPGAVNEVRTNGRDPKKAFNGTFVTWDFQASGSGTGAAGGNIKWGGWMGALQVAVVRIDRNPDASFVYTTVLAGAFPF